MVKAKFRPEQRLRSRRLFQEIFKKGKSAKGNFLRIWVLRVAAAKSASLGIMVSRKIDSRAVKRNVWKRRIKEVFRLSRQRIDAKAAILVQALKPGEAPDYREIKSEFENLLKKTGVFA